MQRRKRFIIVSVVVILLHQYVLIYTHNETWNDVWQRKGIPKRVPRNVTDLTKIDGFDHASEYVNIMHEYKRAIRTMQYTETLCDIGCGSGAFLHIMQHKGLSLCVDLSLNMLRTGQHYNAISAQTQRIIYVQNDIRDLWAVPSAFCDTVVVNGVLFYLENLADVRRAKRELERLTKPGGDVYVFDVRDGDQAAYAHARKRVGLTHTTPHLFIPRDVWGPEWHFTEPSALAKRVYSYAANFSYHVNRRLPI
tara:strand:+ start:40 stop:792 length:753 start_codon:yes stop_codon:yes gene_type:complete